MTDHGNEHAIFSFHGKTNIDGTWMDHTVTDESSRDSRRFGKSNSKGTQGIEGRSSLHCLFFPMGQKNVELNGKHDCGKRTGPTATHGISYGNTHGGGRRDRVSLEILEEALQIINGDATACTASRNSSEISGMEPKFGHTRLHSWREEAGSPGMSWHRETAYGRLDGILNVFVRISSRRSGGFFTLRLLDGRRRVVETKSLSILLADLKISERCPDGIALTDGDGDFLEHSAAGCSHPHDGLVRLNLQQVGISLHAITDGKGRSHDGCLGNGLAELGHDDRKNADGFGRWEHDVGSG